MESTASQAAATHTADAIAAAHEKLLHDGTLQFDFSATTRPPATPDWLARLAEFLSHLRPGFEFLFWTAVVCVAGLIVYTVGREAMRMRRRPPRAVELSRGQIPDWRPSAAPALLADADALAAQEKYSEAVHLLLLRSIDDIDERRPRTLRPALTSRDIAHMADLPPLARAAFGQIAAVVERSLFGGRTLGAADFAQCRRIYENFALPISWGGEQVSITARLKPA